MFLFKKRKLIFLEDNSRNKYIGLPDSGTSVDISMTQEAQNATGCWRESNTGVANVGHLGHPSDMTEITEESLCSLSA